MRHTALMASLPRSVKPMKAVLGDGLPHDDPDDPQWTYELKWDGMRVLAYIDPAADPRPGPTGMPCCFAQWMKSQTIRK